MSEENNGAKQAVGMLWVVMLSLLLAIFGGVMLYNGKGAVVWFYYVVAAMLCITGIGSVYGYYKNKHFRDITKYGFSIGLFQIIIGICVLIRARDFVYATFELFGLLLLVDAVIVLQYGIDIEMMRGKSAGIMMFFAVAEAVFASVAIAEPRRVFHQYPQVFYIALIVFGIISIVAMVLAARHTGLMRQNELRDKYRILEDEPVANGTMPAEQKKDELSEV